MNAAQMLPGCPAYFVELLCCMVPSASCRMPHASCPVSPSKCSEESQKVLGAMLEYARDWAQVGCCSSQPRSWCRWVKSALRITSLRPRWRAQQQHVWPSSSTEQRHHASLSCHFMQEGSITTVFVAHDWATVERLTGAPRRAGQHGSGRLGWQGVLMWHLMLYSWRCHGMAWHGIVPTPWHGGMAWHGMVRSCNVVVLLPCSALLVASTLPKQRVCC